jgi:hypothetical protein
MASPDAKPTYRAEFLTAPELSAWPQLAVKRSSKFLGDHLRVISELTRLLSQNCRIRCAQRPNTE